MSVKVRLPACPPLPTMPLMVIELTLITRSYSLDPFAIVNLAGSSSCASPRAIRPSASAVVIVTDLIAACGRQKPKPAPVIGTGVIGASWAALFLAKGLEVVGPDRSSSSRWAASLWRHTFFAQPERLTPSIIELWLSASDRMTQFARRFAMDEMPARLEIQPKVKTSAAGLRCRSANSVSS
jgi:hypothetical protein